MPRKSGVTDPSKVEDGREDDMEDVIDVSLKASKDYGKLETGKETEVPEDEVSPEKSEDDAVKVKSKDKSDDQSDDQTDFKKLSVRETLKHALKEHNESEQEKVQEDKTKEDETKIKTKDEKESEYDVPSSWSKKKEVWNKLDNEAKAFISQREKEISDGFAKYGDDNKRFKDLDNVIAPRRESIQRSGFQEHQVIDKLFQWMESLSGPYKIDAFKALGQNFGIDLSQINPATSSMQDNTRGNQNTNSESDADLPPAIKQYFENVNSELQNISNKLQTKDQQEASNFVSAWAADKPHYDNVRTIMHSLLASGTIPLKNGQLDLDTAYGMATRAHPEVSASIVKENEDKRKEAEQKKAEEIERKKQEKLAASRKASASLKVRAPMGGVSNSLNGNKPNPVKLSVRDSIKSAMKEVLESS